MGVPAFYKWLSQRYPKIIKDVVEDFPQLIDGTEIPVDASTPNPNGIEFDNLYLDMNGIIHPCFHPEDKPSPMTELEVFENIFEYIDRLFCMVRPRRLIYMAIDGVAPRAKMNQQRMRRFRAAKDRADMKIVEESIIQEYAAIGKMMEDKQEQKAMSEVWDSNTITPGTPFMGRLAAALQYYIHKKLNYDKGWSDVEVILSDSNDPGEGEHKVMQFIRQQRDREGWNPNSKHVVYGLDADLIMLSLATHEPHFFVLREIQSPEAAQVIKENRESLLQEKLPNSAIAAVYKKPFQFLQLEVLREYLKMEFLDDPNFSESKQNIDVERLYDDFVFMCFFVGNDFLPHSPTLDIREGGITLLMQTYKSNFKRVGYLTNGSQVNLDKVEIFLQEIAKHEQDILTKRTRKLRAEARRAERQKEQQLGQQQELGQKNNQSLDNISQKQQRDNHRYSDSNGNISSSINNANKEAARAIKEKFKRHSAGDVNEQQQPSKKNKIDNQQSNHDQEVIGKLSKRIASISKKAISSQKQVEKELDVQTQIHNALKLKQKELVDCQKQVLEEDQLLRLDEEGYKDRYYSIKLKVTSEYYESIVKDMVNKYIEGACWVMSYYYEGCTSWSWYYPYQYAPFTSDFKDFSNMNVKFTEGNPFKPFDQLMAVLPAASAHCLPEVYQHLFTDENSPILDYYPENFEVDMNGHRFAWQGVALLPFIDEKRLLDAIRPYDTQLNEAEKFRNQRSDRLMFVHQQHQLSESFARAMGHKEKSYGLSISVVLFSYNGASKTVEKVNESLATKNVKIIIDTSKSKGTIGFLGACQGESNPSVMPAPYGLQPDITTNKVYCASYHLPKYQRHQSKLMPGTMVNTKLKWELHLNLNPNENVLWHEMGKPGQNNRNRHRQFQQQGTHYQPHVNSHRSTYQYDRGTYYDDHQLNNKPNIQIRPNQPPQHLQGNYQNTPQFNANKSSATPQLYSQNPQIQGLYVQQPQNTQQQYAQQYNNIPNQNMQQYAAPQFPQQQTQYNQYQPPSVQQQQYQRPYTQQNYQQQQNNYQHSYQQAQQAPQQNNSYQQNFQPSYSQNSYGVSYYPNQQYQQQGYQQQNQQQNPRGQADNRFLPLRRDYQQ